MPVLVLALQEQPDLVLVRKPDRVSVEVDKGHIQDRMRMVYLGMCLRRCEFAGGLNSLSSPLPYLGTSTLSWYLYLVLPSLGVRAGYDAYARHHYTHPIASARFPLPLLFRPSFVRF